MKTIPLLVRRVPQELHEALKAKAKANHRSLNAEVLSLLEAEASEPPPIKGRELARRLRKAQKLLTKQERLEFARDVERGIELMRSRERLPEP